MAHYHWLLDNTRETKPLVTKKHNKKTQKRQSKRGHIIKFLLTEFGRAGQENIWLSVMTHGSYVMTSSQIFSRPALPEADLKLRARYYLIVRHDV